MSVDHRFGTSLQMVMMTRILNIGNHYTERSRRVEPTFPQSREKYTGRCISAVATDTSLDNSIDLSRIIEWLQVLNLPQVREQLRFYIQKDYIGVL